MKRTNERWIHSMAQTAALIPDEFSRDYLEYKDTGTIIIHEGLTDELSGFPGVADWIGKVAIIFTDMEPEPDEDYDYLEVIGELCRKLVAHVLHLKTAPCDACIKGYVWMAIKNVGGLT